ncbi:hypothetical protein G7Z17_g3288 [Cylindrodendrum hubeiense]|uniref:Uncharacterized protein n=1 Tax=Cylindrodendrum hubeiense TaxID=595255 RepID=A0A9P5HG74_9HYPO|nr:hypothetical protein G7Z17_g3288 [Cylindrodendrum hubeiense]
MTSSSLQAHASGPQSAPEPTGKTCYPLQTALAARGQCVAGASDTTLRERVCSVAQHTTLRMAYYSAVMNDSTDCFPREASPDALPYHPVAVPRPLPLGAPVPVFSRVGLRARPELDPDLEPPADAAPDPIIIVLMPPRTAADRSTEPIPSDPVSAPTSSRSK